MRVAPAAEGHGPGRWSGARSRRADAAVPEPYRRPVGAADRPALPGAGRARLGPGSGPARARLGPGSAAWAGRAGAPDGRGTRGTVDAPARPGPGWDM
ncbi:hypothetical protein ADZ36_04555 [Streptomyces fradiae]|uniref:Uncharacterized protein n=2 Tax=Streptomyces TaxID=1883 RepID=A0A3R7FKY0_9ACTN|nr:hypothetical protein ADZ36_04555 [Streptomyces fradiae]PQM25240.1 hypothetical protein Sfr7A_03655 [Streptomyces xinghaiensis]RKM99292.1 hypothetical protein SFRA_003655 [Streptomyces xinghaiensis]RNC75804.1 hypothetical protein DC095_000720 [Streptomyces xinghaiensis]